MKKGTIFITILLLALNACKKNEVTPTPNINPGTDPNFKIVINSDAPFKAFNRKVEVFGIPIYAVPKVEDAKLLHAANIMAQYLDNDEDGTVDDPKVLSAMKNAKAFMVMWKKESDFENMEEPPGRDGQDLGNDETHPEWHKNKTGEFDAALEEVLHIITHAGYANAYPKVFGEVAGTTLTDAMDIARGGHFESIPNSYPSDAWYTYDDKTCGYSCMATEYLYWSLTSLLGAQKNRLNEIQQEWKLNTPELLKATDFAIYTLLTDPQFKVPTKLPDGIYRR